MQGMMIQNFESRAKTNAPVGTKEVADSAEKPFGEVLGGEEEKVIVQPKKQASKKVEKEDAGVIKAGNSEKEEHGDVALINNKEAQESTLDEEPLAADSSAAPFFMAALIDQSASFVASPQNTELVAAAERTQELIGDWLQPQQDGPHDLGEVLVAALEVLDQTSEPTISDDRATDAAQPVLSDEEIAELKGLMAVMLQSGQVPEPFAGHPLIADLKRQLASVPELKVAVAQAAQTDKQFAVAALAASEQEPEVVAGASVDPVADVSLQENQIARFLKPRREQLTLHEEYAEKGSVDRGAVVNGGVAKEDLQIAAGSGTSLEEAEPHVEISLDPAKVDIQSLATKIQPQAGLQVASSGPQQGLPLNNEGPRMMQLPSGLQMAENQLVDQVVTHLAGSADGETGRIRLRLHPAELGSIRLDLIVEGDRLRAHLQAQTHQVQEVLDRNLTQLKNALQQQGLKIDEFRVDVQSGQGQAADQGFSEQQQQQQQQQASRQSPWLDTDWQQPELDIPLQQLVQSAGGGISLRV